MFNIWEVFKYLMTKIPLFYKNTWVYKNICNSVNFYFVCVKLCAHFPHQINTFWTTEWISYNICLALVKLPYDDPNEYLTLSVMIRVNFVLQCLFCDIEVNNRNLFVRDCDKRESCRMLDNRWFYIY